MVGVVLITAQFWRVFSVSMIDLAARGRVIQELRFAVDSIASDFGAVVGATPVGSNRVLLCKDGGEYPNGTADWTAPDIVIDYFVVNGQLRRHNQSTGTEITVADSVSAFTAENISGSRLRMVVELQCHDTSRQATFLWRRP